MNRSQNTDVAPAPRVFPSPPRQVRLRAFPWGIVLFVLLMSSIGVALCVVSFGSMSLTLAAKWCGEVVDGEVVGKTTRGRRGRENIVLFHFQLDGEDYRSEMRVDDRSFDAVRVGERVHVHVWPVWPTQSAWIDESHVHGSWTIACMGLFGIFWSFILGMILWTFIKEARRRRRLASHGTARIGFISHKEIFRGKTTVYRLTYRYRTPTAPSAAPERKATMDVTPQQYQLVEVGDAVTILYDPHKPDSSVVHAFNDYLIAGLKTE